MQWFEWPPSGSAFIFGPMAWLGFVIGFVLGIFTFHPIKTANKFYAYWRQKEIANRERRKARKQNKTI